MNSYTGRNNFMPMSAEKYQYLVAGLPDLMMDAEKLSLSIVAFRDVLEEQLPNKDLQLVRFFFLPFDNQNLLNLLNGVDFEFDTRGNFSREYLEALAEDKSPQTTIEQPANIDEYFEKFIIHFKNDIALYPGKRWEDQLTNHFYDFVLSSKHLFIYEWFFFDRSLRNVQIGMNANNHDFSVEKNLIGNDEVTHAILNVSAKDFGLSNDYDFVPSLMSLFEGTTLVEREYRIDQLKWQKLDDLTTFNYFSIEVILAFLVKLQIVERWFSLSEEKGREMFDLLFKNLQNSYEFPKEFV